jgi:hypothetical protein
MTARSPRGPSLFNIRQKSHTWWVFCTSPKDSGCLGRLEDHRTRHPAETGVHMLRRIKPMQQVAPHQDLVEADLRCLMCNRLVGQLTGLQLRGDREERSLCWSSFRAASADGPSVLFTGRERFRCQACGGAVVMEEISISAIRKPVVLDDDCPVHRERIPRRGRPPRGCLCNEVGVAA